MSRIDLRIASLGSRLGLPERRAKQIIRARRILEHPMLYVRRRSIPKNLGASPWFSYVDRELGYRTFEPDGFPGIADLVSACADAFKATGGIDSTENAKKPFFTNILSNQDLDRYPALMDFALSEPVLAAVTGYLGTLPRLKGMGLYYSPPNETTRSSQLFHYDHDDDRQLKCFVNVLPVSEANGPFTFLPKPVSDRVFAAAGGRYLKGRFRTTTCLTMRPGRTVNACSVHPAGVPSSIHPTACTLAAVPEKEHDLPSWCSTRRFPISVSTRARPWMACRYTPFRQAVLRPTTCED